MILRMIWWRSTRVPEGEVDEGERTVSQTGDDERRSRWLATAAFAAALEVYEVGWGLVEASVDEASEMVLHGVPFRCR